VWPGKYGWKTCSDFGVGFDATEELVIGGDRRRSADLPSVADLFN